MKITKVTDIDGVEAVVALAREVWVEYYASIIGVPQVDYMLEKFQSIRAINRQIKDGLEYYLLVEDEVMAGYIAVLAEPDEGRMLLSKFYISSAFRGRGLGRVALAFVEELCLKANLGILWLTVNKRNPTVKTYEAMGFHTASELVTDIGGGFVMDDFIMEKCLSRACPGASLRGGTGLSET